MSWDLVHPVLSRIVRGTTPPSRRNGASSAFTEVDWSLLGETRTFALRVDSVRAVGPLMPSTQSLRSLVDVTLHVAYRHDKKQSNVDHLIVADYLAIRARLLSPSLWEQPSSTIEAVAEGSGRSMLPMRIERDTGASALYSFGVEFIGAS